MTIRAEIQRAIDQIDQAQVAGVDVRGVGDRMRARLVALDEAPAGAGWEYLAGRGDAGAQAVLRSGRGTG